MSSLALMRLLEAAPDRYDAGMRILTLDRAACVHDALARAAAPRPGLDVVEIGCGTGALTARLVARGARVTAIDQSPEMLEQARARLADAAPGAVTFVERTAAELDALPAASCDAVVASFALSEMSPSGRAFVLGEAHRCLRPGGVLAVGDEVVPRRWWQRLVHAALRVPQAVVGWLAIGAVSGPIRDLGAEVRGAGFVVREEEAWLWGRLAVVVAERPA